MAFKDRDDKGDLIKEKRCPKCGLLLPLSEFRTKKIKFDGKPRSKRRNICKTCEWILRVEKATKDEKKLKKRVRRKK